MGHIAISWVDPELQQRPVSLLLSLLRKHNATFSRLAHCVFRFFCYYRFTHTGALAHIHARTFTHSHIQIQTVMHRHAFGHVFKVCASFFIHMQMCFHWSFLNSYFYFIFRFLKKNVTVNIQNRVISGRTQWNGKSSRVSFGLGSIRSKWGLLNITLYCIIRLQSITLGDLARLQTRWDRSIETRDKAQQKPKDTQGYACTGKTHRHARWGCKGRDRRVW